MSGVWLPAFKSLMKKVWIFAFILGAGDAAVSTAWRNHFVVENSVRPGCYLYQTAESKKMLQLQSELPVKLKIIKDDEGNRVFGFTQFSKGETPVIAISAELNIMDATEIFAHELAHVAAGEGAGHGERWDKEFQRIFDEYNQIGKGRFGEDGKEIETAPEYRGGWIRSEDRMPEEGEDVLVWFEYFRFGNYQELFQTVGISCTWRGKWSGFVNGSSGWRDLRIIAWQPLPEPYREEQENNGEENE